jgi:hypothetical protein
VAQGVGSGFKPQYCKQINQSIKKIQNKARCSFLYLFFGKVLEVLAGKIRQENEIKGKYITKEELKKKTKPRVFLFTNTMIVYVENSKESTEKKFVK